MKRRFSPEFKLESAQLVLDQYYSIRDAAKAMNVSKSAMESWVRQLKQERHSVYCTDEYRSELTRAGIGYVPFC
ncbi:transposase [Xenorhabdus indica]|nr:transposase [Xenorhabdus indica]